MNSYSYEFTKYNTLPCGLASSRAPIRGSTVVCFLSCLLCEVLLQTLAIEFGAVLVCVHRTVAGRVPGPLVPALQEQKSQQNGPFIVHAPRKQTPAQISVQQVKKLLFLSHSPSLSVWGGWILEYSQGCCGQDFQSPISRHLSFSHCLLACADSEAA